MCRYFRKRYHIEFSILDCKIFIDIINVFVIEFSILDCKIFIDIINVFVYNLTDILETGY